MLKITRSLAYGLDEEISKEYKHEYFKELLRYENKAVISIIEALEDLSDKASIYDTIKLTLFQNSNPYENSEEETLFEKATRLHESDPDVQLVARAIGRELSFQELINLGKITEEEMKNDEEFQRVTQEYYFRWWGEEYTRMKEENDSLKRKHENDLPF
ncbi:hypothetical protein [Pontibacter sp. Tf4]|uniref:hypothetical protein n=1 Tax=Pontibacter sp. Tf4 TaxID=2761620 RepID=UPI00162419F1|nr:hypothetical protein [Pontibacter sp. Tf4]